VPVGGKTTWLAAGNYYGVLPRERQYDAPNPGIFTYNKEWKKLL